MMVDLRGPCGHLAAKLNVADGVIVKKCPQCTKAAGQSVYHCFDVATGALLVDTLTLGPARGPAGDPTPHAPEHPPDHPTSTS